ncbi:hypothetical protein M758_UG047500 [Ceratodon purpureus]|nr:hypothetical protein M758_UG047500 [Ceratodon purpureus]
MTQNYQLLIRFDGLIICRGCHDIIKHIYNAVLEVSKFGVGIAHIFGTVTHKNISPFSVTIFGSVFCSKKFSGIFKVFLYCMGLGIFSLLRVRNKKSAIIFLSRN